jgi:hypothetical protein
LFPQDYYGVLCSGFYSSYSPKIFSGIGTECKTESVLSGSGVNLGTVVTGYKTVITYSTGYVPTGCFQSGYSYFVGTGITGYENKFVGNVLDNCGVLNPVYALSPLTGNIYSSGVTGVCTGLAQVITQSYTNIELSGVISGEVFVPVDKTTCSEYSGYYPASIIVDSGFIFSLGFDNIYSFESVENIKSNESYFYTGGNIYNNINLKPTYDSLVFDYKIPQSDIGSGQNMFFNNGQLLLESGWSSYQDGYSTLYNITGNIFLDNDIVRSNSYNEIADNLIYDHHLKLNGSYSPIINVLEKTGWASGSAYTGFGITPTIIRPDLYFLNGIKLLSGEDYANTQTSGLRFKFDIPISSVLSKVIDYFLSSGGVYMTGSNNLIRLNSGKFLKNTSQVYTNGMRQVPNYGYVEKSSFDLLSGNFSNSYNSLLYTSSKSDNFWNM